MTFEWVFLIAALLCFAYFAGIYLLERKDQLKENAGYERLLFRVSEVESDFKRFKLALEEIEKQAADGKKILSQVQLSQGLRR